MVAFSFRAKMIVFCPNGPTQTTNVTHARDQGATPFELLALLLLALPLLLTLQKLVVLLALGERSHQLLADRATMQDLTQLFGKIFISGAI